MFVTVAFRSSPIRAVSTLAIALASAPEALIQRDLMGSRVGTASKTKEEK